MNPGMKRNLLAWALCLPTLFPLTIFIVWPACQSLYLSLHDVDPFSGRAVFVAIDNYVETMSSPEYWQSVLTTVLFMVLTVIPSIVLSLAIALALDANPYVHGFFRTVFLMPVAISSAMAAMLWIFIYNPTAGYLNYALGHFGIDGPQWLSDPSTALLAVSIATVWKEIGFNIIFFLAGLAGVPRDLTEAATLDGATAWQRFLHVILPILSPTLFFVTTVSVINSFQSFGQIHILTGGGPAGATNVLVYNLYQEGFVNFRTGFASAQAVILFVILTAVTALQFRMARRRVHYG